MENEMSVDNIMRTVPKTWLCRIDARFNKGYSNPSCIKVDAKMTKLKAVVTWPTTDVETIFVSTIQ